MKKQDILFDVGGIHIKVTLTDGPKNIPGKIHQYPTYVQEDKDKILGNFAEIIRKFVQNEEVSVDKIGMAFPGLFDYQKGGCLLKGLNKYDSIYGLCMKEELKKRVPEGECFITIHTRNQLLTTIFLSKD